MNYRMREMQVRDKRNQEILKLAEAGVYKSHIARLVGVHRATVHRVIKKGVQKSG
jgi:DNA invertase Pin-like site-specific DNA recombinase